MEHTNLSFVRAAEDDVDELIRVQNAAFEPDYHKYGECPAYVEDRDKMHEWVRTAILYKVMLDGAVVGTIELREREPTHYHLRVLAVDPQYHNRGIGTKALEFIFAQHPSITTWTLVTPKDNGRNCHLYEKVGFKAISDRVHSDLLTLVLYQRDCA